MENLSLISTSHQLKEILHKILRMLFIPSPMTLLLIFYFLFFPPAAPLSVTSSHSSSTAWNEINSQRTDFKIRTIDITGLSVFPYIKQTVPAPIYIYKLTVLTLSFIFKEGVTQASRAIQGQELSPAFLFFFCKKWCHF